MSNALAGAPDPISVRIYGLRPLRPIPAVRPNARRHRSGRPAQRYRRLFGWVCDGPLFDGEAKNRTFVSGSIIGSIAHERLIRSGSNVHRSRQTSPRWTIATAFAYAANGRVTAVKIDCCYNNESIDRKHPESCTPGSVNRYRDGLSNYQRERNHKRMGRWLSSSFYKTMLAELHMIWIRSRD